MIDTSKGCWFQPRLSRDQGNSIRFLDHLESLYTIAASNPWTLVMQLFSYTDVVIIYITVCIQIYCIA